MLLPTPPRAAPPRLGPYRVTGELGRGGMGVVYRGQHEELGVERALKLLDRLDPKSLARFEREANHLAHIRHPNVVAIHDVGVDDGRPWFAMTLVDGRPLDDVLEGARLPLPTALALAAGIAAGVGALHQAGVVHRDLKPGNVVVTGDGQPIVLDLGLAVAPDRDERLTKTGTTLGTVSYMAPEQFHGAEQATPATDVHALGLILFELTTGTPAMEQGSVQEIAAAILTEDRRLPTQLDSTLPASLDRLCRRATARDPGDRFPDADAFAAALRDLSARPGPSRRAVRLRRVAAVALIAGVLSAAGWALRPRPTDPTPIETDLAQPRAATPTEAAPPTARAPRTPGRPWRRLQHATCRGTAWLDATRLLTWGEDRTIRLWDVEAAQVVRRWTTSGGMITSAAVSSTGQIAFADPVGVHVIARLDGEPALLFRFTRRIHPRDLAYSPSGIQLAVGGRHEPSVLMLDASRGRLLRSIGRHGGKVDSIAFSPDGKLLATACGESLQDAKNISRDNAVRIFDARTGDRRRRIGFMGQGNSVAFAPDGKRLAAAVDGQSVVLIDAQSGARTQLQGSNTRVGFMIIAAHAGIVRAVTFSPDGAWLLSVSDGAIPSHNELRVWDAASGAELAVLSSLGVSGMRDLVVSPSGRDVALSHLHGVWIYDRRGLISPRTSPRDNR